MKKITRFLGTWKLWIHNHPRRVQIVTGIVLAACAALIVLWYGATVGAAKIFNKVVNERQMFPGTVTVERISANMLGDVSFEGLKWTDKNGELLADLPEGRFRVKIWDVLTRHIGTRTLTEVELDGGMFHFYLDDHMNVLNITPEKGEEDKGLPLTITGKKGNRKFVSKVTLKNMMIRTDMPGRKLIIPNVNADIDLNTGGVTRAQINAGHFSGTIEAGGLSIDGTIDFRKETPIFDMDLYIKDCNPESLKVGVNINNPASVHARISGTVPSPVVDGTLTLKKMDLPVLPFTDVKGDFHYQDGKLNAPEVTAKVYGGDVEASGSFDIDNHSYDTHIKGHNLEAADVEGSGGIHCKVELDLYMKAWGGNETQVIEGSFWSGKGRYHIIPFDKISGTFKKENGVLHFSDVTISMAMGDVKTAGFSIVDGKVHLTPIYVEDRDNGSKERVW